MNTEQIMALADAYAIAHCNFVIPQMARKHLQAAIEALVQDRDALFGSQELIAHVAAALSERMTSAEAERDKLAAENKVLRDALSDAATSLETVSVLAGRNTYGLTPIPSYMDTFEQVRGYAASRSSVASEALQGANHEPD